MIYGTSNYVYVNQFPMVSSNRIVLSNAIEL